jgi:hypothetical protein
MPGRKSQRFYAEIAVYMVFSMIFGGLDWLKGVRILNEPMDFLTTFVWEVLVKSRSRFLVPKG